MASHPKAILVFGATGVIGQYIIKALIAEKANFGRLAIFTSPSTVGSKAGEIGFLKSNCVEVVVGDVRDEQQVRDAYNKGFDTVISAVGRNVIAEQINLVRIAESCPVVKRFFPSEYGTDIEYWPHSVHEKPHQQKLKVRAYIKENVKRLEYTYLVTGPYSDLYLGKMDAEKVGSFDVRAKRAVLLGSGNDRISFTTMLDVGKLLVAALKHPDISRNRALLVNSFTTTPNEILAEFEKQTDSKWSVKYNPLDDLKHQEQDAWERQDPLATLYTLRRIWTEGGTLYEKRDNEILEATDMETLEDAVRCAIETEAAGYRSGKM